MPLRSFTVGNFRSFVEPAKIDLRPLTLLFGYNNAGKSALARVLPLLADSVGSRPGLPLNLASPAMRGGEFADLRSRLTGALGIDISLVWDEPSVPRLSLTLQDLPERRQQVVDHLEICEQENVALWGEWAPPEGAGPVRETIYKLSKISGDEGHHARIEWHGLVPRVVENIPSSAAPILRALEPRLRELQSTLWVGAIRRSPPRVQPPPSGPPLGLGHDGDGASDALAWDKATGGPLLPRIADWYEAHAQARLDVQLTPQSYALVVGEHGVKLADTGEGLAQVLPVLVAGALAEQRAQEGASHLVVEQPELHLHPAAHAPLAGYFCTIAQRDRAPRMLIETHSENFLFGVQIAVARGELDPKRVLIYWVRQHQGHSTLTRIELDQWGRPDNWPRGVFTEETELARQLLEERKKRGYK